MAKIAVQKRNIHLSPPQILALGFSFLIAMGTLLLSLPIATKSGVSMDLIDAFFTATSAVCVTGLVVEDTQNFFSTFGQVVILVLIQIGGLGFMTMSTMFALILGKRITLRERLLMQEALNQMSVEGVVKLTQYVLLFTLLIEGVGAFLLALRWIPDLGLGKGIYYGIFHSISAFCNAGFDLFSVSMMNYKEDFLVNMVITSLIIFGGLGFTVIVDLYNKKAKWRVLSLHTKVVLTTTGILIALGTMVVFVLELSNPKTLGQLSMQGKILAAYFQGVVPRTAGYNSVPITELRDATLFIMIILMFIGASPGSTGGGVKTTTISALGLAVWSIARGKQDVEAFERRLPATVIYKSLAVTMISLAVVILVTILLTISEEKFRFLQVLFEATSAFGTVGLSMGVSPELSNFGKFLIALTMFTGRVGPLTLAFALAESGKKAILHYPEEKIIVG